VKPVLNHLMQLQELCFALSERQASTKSKRHLTELESAIAKMRRRLSPEVLPIFDRLRQRGPLIVAPIVDGACAACRQSLPTSLDFDVRTDAELHQCPRCGRILYEPEAPVRHTGKHLGERGRPTAGISQFSSGDLVIPQMKAKTRRAAIAELAALMVERGFVSERVALTNLALAREAIESTAIERGLAFPHVRGIEGGGLTIALGMKGAGIDFRAPDKHLTRIIFFTVIPTAASAFYLRLLAGLIRAFQQTEHRRALLACKSAEEAWERLVELTGGVIH
jgi:mannitol/fructose-specific phosphotransferase system IIA component (Ntr-type)